jgi:hypothetical protein
MQPEFDAVVNAVVGAAPKSEHRDLYGKADGDWVPRWSTLLGGSGLGDATRLVAQGATVPVEEVADSFVAFCTAPAPAVEDWLLLTGELPEGTRIPLGRYTLQTFTAEELRQLGPMPAAAGTRPDNGSCAVPRRTREVPARHSVRQRASDLPMISFMISVVPANSVLARVSRKSLAIEYSVM